MCSLHCKYIDTHSLTHAYTHSLTHSLIHSFTHSFTHSKTGVHSCLLVLFLAFFFCLCFCLCSSLSLSLYYLSSFYSHFLCVDTPSPGCLQPVIFVLHANSDVKFLNIFAWCMVSRNFSQISVCGDLFPPVMHPFRKTSCSTGRIILACDLQLVGRGLDYGLTHGG